MTNERLDEAIDTVAREMTSRQPHDAAIFRRRVLARIDQRDTSHRTRRIAWMLSPIGAVALIAIAAALLRLTNPTTSAGVARPVDPRAQAGAFTQSADVAPTPPDRPNGGNTRRLENATRQRNASRFAFRPRGGGRYHAASLFTIRQNMAGTPAATSLDELIPPALTIDPIAVNPIAVARLKPADPIPAEQLDPIPPLDVTPLGLDESPRRQE